MSKFSILSILFLMTISLFSPKSRSEVGGQKITELTCGMPAHHLPPFVIGESEKLDSKWPGITIEKLREAAAISNIKLNIQRLPFARMAQFAIKGKIDCIVRFEPTSKDDPIFFSDLVFPLNNKGEVDRNKSLSDFKLWIYSNKKSFIERDGQKLEPNVEVHSPMQEFNPFLSQRNVAVVSVNRDLRNQLLQLESGRIKALLAPDMLVEPLLSRENLAEITKSGKPVVELYNYLVFSKKFYAKNKDAAKRFWKSFYKVRADSKWQQRLKEYQNIREQ